MYYWISQQLYWLALPIKIKMLIDNIPKTIFRYENNFKLRLGTKI